MPVGAIESNGGSFMSWKGWGARVRGCNERNVILRDVLWEVGLFMVNLDWRRWKMDKGRLRDVDRMLKLLVILFRNLRVADSVPRFEGVD